jgi:spermidine synthase
VRQSLADVGFYSAAQLMATFAAKRPEIDPWIEDAELNRDRNLRLQYLAGEGVNLYQADQIYRSMAQYRTYPRGLFSGSQERLDQLDYVWETSGQ